MTAKVAPGILLAAPNADDIAREASARMAYVLRRAIAARGSATIAVSGGNTPRAAYALLAKESIAWANVDVFWVDERVAAPTDDRSNYFHAKASLLEPAKIPSDRVHRMETDRPDLEAAARDYEALVKKRVALAADGVPAFDLMILGIGDDGHTASLFPGDGTVHTRDRLVIEVAAKEKREARMTVTAPVLEHAHDVIVIATGKAKHGPLTNVWNDAGDVDVTPARVIRGCQGTVAWIVDHAACGME